MVIFHGNAYHSPHRKGVNMGFMNLMPVMMMVIFCVVGLFAVLLVGGIVAVAIYGLKHWNVRVSTGKRNFDDFGR